MAQKFRDLIANKPPAWDAAVATRKWQLLSEGPHADRVLNEESADLLPGEEPNPE